MAGFPNLDSDLDGLHAFAENCPFAFNPGQEPTLDDSETGLACLCGDVTDDGTVDSLDELVFRDHLAVPEAGPTPGHAKCTVIEPLRGCDVRDLVVIRRALDSPPRPPFISEACEAARP